MAGSAVIGALRVNLGIDSAAFSSGLKQAQSGLARFGSWAKTGLMAVGAAATAAAAGMAYAVKQTIDNADAMSKMAQKIGIPIEELSRLKYVADLSGVSLGTLANAIKRLSTGMTEALAKPTGAAAKKFQELGIEIANADGSLRSSQAVLADLADRFATMPDGAEKTALAIKVLGKAGAEMIPLLNGGSDALNKMMTEADTFGQVFTAEMGKSAEAFNDNISRLQGVVGNLAARIATDLLPHLERFTNWLVENAPAITNFVVQTVEAFATLGSAIASTVNFFTQLDAAIRSFGDQIRAVIAELPAFAAEIVNVFAAIPGKMVEIGAQIIQGLWDGLKSQFSSVKDWLVGSVGGMVDSVKAKLGIQSPSKVMHEVGTNIVEGLGDGMESLSGNISSIAQSIGDTILTAFEGVIDGTKTVKEAIADVLKSLAKLLINNAFKMLFGGGGGIGGGFGGFLSGIFGKIFGFARGGTILPGGAGGIDSQLVAFRKSPNERVDITKPGQTLSNGPQEITISGTFIDDNGVIKAQVTTMGQQAARAGAAAGVRQVRANMPGLIAETQMRTL